MGVSSVTGDYSRGGERLLDRERADRLSGQRITIAGNLKDMFHHLTAANDLTFRYGTNAPTVRVEGMTIAGA